MNHRNEILTRAGNCLAVALISLCLVSCPPVGNPDAGAAPKSVPPKSVESPTGSDGKGYALAIGLNRVDPAHYDGWDGELMGCEPDANDMTFIAKSQGFETEALLTAAATRGAVLDRLGAYAEKLRPPDLLVVSYSGHGGQIKDLNGDEADGLDETWCLYDGELLDDELHGAWTKFAEGVRILVFSDSCHSGTVVRMRGGDFDNPTETRIRELDDSYKQRREPPIKVRENIFKLPETRKAIEDRKDVRKRFEAVRAIPSPAAPAPAPPPEPLKEVFLSKAMPPKVAVNTYIKNKEFYDNLGTAAPREDMVPAKASVILIAGCEDDQSSADCIFNGLFTIMVKRVWDNGAFSGNYIQFHKAIREKVLAENQDQSPKLSFDGNPDLVFRGQRPYSLR